MQSLLQRNSPGRVLIIDDEECVHDGLRRYLEPHFAVVSAYNLLQARVALARETNLRLALVDLDLPGGSGTDDPNQPRGGFSLVSPLKARFPGALVIIFSAHVSGELVNTAQRLGAEYIHKSDWRRNCEMLVSRVLRRSRPDTRAAVIDTLVERSGLTPRHEELLWLALAGNSHKEMTGILDISVETVRSHAATICRRCGAQSLAEIATRIRESEIAVLRRMQPATSNQQPATSNQQPATMRAWGT